MKTNDFPGHEDHSAKLQAITAVARAFIEAWYAADAERMKSSLHSELVKRSLYRSSQDGSLRLRRPATAAMLTGWTEAGGGSDLAVEDQTYEITVCDIFRDIASVRVDSHEYVDYLHLARVEGSWKIVHDLWQLKQGDLPDS